MFSNIIKGGKNPMGTIIPITQVRDNIMGLVIGVNSYKLTFATCKEAEKFHRELISAYKNQSRNVEVLREMGSNCVKICFDTVQNPNVEFKIPFPNEQKAKDFSEDFTSLFEQQ